MDNEFPDKIQTTTTSYPAAYQAKPNQEEGGRIAIDKAYLRSLPSILHIVQIVLSFFYWVILCAVQYFAVGYMITVGITAMIETIIYFVVFLLRVNEKIVFIAWELSEFILYCVVTGLYLLAAIITSVRAGQSKYWSDHGKLVFCTLLAWALTLLYAAGIFFSFRAFTDRRHRRAPERTTTSTTTTTTTMVTEGTHHFTETSYPQAPGAPDAPPVYSP